MKIVSLKAHKQFISILAKWHYDEWSYLHYVDSVERRISEFEDELESDEIPQTFVAVEDDALVGSASLLSNDMDTRTDLTPWLASVYVPAEYRKKGFGSALVRHIVTEACKRGYRTLYLYTPGREDFYARLGWSLIERTEYHGHNVSIMTINTE